MKNVGMLAPVLFVMLGTSGFAQDEPPLEPIPMPTPADKADASDAVSAGTVDAVSHEKLEMPLDGPVFPDSTIVVEETPAEPIELETVIESPTRPAAPAAFKIAPSHQGQTPVVRGRGVNQPPANAARAQTMTYEQSYRYQPGRRRVFERASYQTTYPSHTGVAVYRTSPTGVVEMRRVAPANYAVQVQVPVRAVGPYPIYRRGYAAAYGPLTPMVPAPYALPPAPYVPGQPVRNAIRSMFW